MVNDKLTFLKNVIEKVGELEHTQAELSEAKAYLNSNAHILADGKIQIGTFSIDADYLLNDMPNPIYAQFNLAISQYVDYVMARTEELKQSLLDNIQIMSVDQLGDDQKKKNMTTTTDDGRLPSSTIFTELTMDSLSVEEDTSSTTPPLLSSQETFTSLDEHDEGSAVDSFRTAEKRLESIQSQLTQQSFRTLVFSKQNDDPAPLTEATDIHKKESLTETDYVLQYIKDAKNYKDFTSLEVQKKIKEHHGIVVSTELIEDLLWKAIAMGQLKLRYQIECHHGHASRVYYVDPPLPKLVSCFQCGNKFPTITNAYQKESLG